MHKIIAGLVLTCGLAACGTAADSDVRPPTPPWINTERLAYWRNLAENRQCPELNELEETVLRDYWDDDRTEALTAIHERQVEAHC